MNIIRSSFSSHQILCIGTLGFLATVSGFGTAPEAQASDTMISEAIGETPTDHHSASSDLQAAGVGSPYSTQAADLLNDSLTEVSSENVFTASTQLDLVAQVADVPAGNGEAIADIQVRFVEQTGASVEGQYREHIITREFELEPGDIYDATLAQEGLAKVGNLPGIVDANLSLEPADEGQVIMVVTVREGTPGIAFGRHFALIPGADAERPNALQGTTIAPAVRTGPPRPTGFLLPLSFEYFNIGGNDQTLTLGIKPGDQTLGFDLTFRDPWIAGTENRLGYAVNLFALSHKAPAFQNGPNDLDIITDSDPWENRFGGGVQFFRPFSENFEAAIGLTYQEVSFGDTVYGSQRFSEDEDGNALTVSGDSSDDLLMLTLNTLLENRNDTIFPTAGNRFQFGIDQAIPVGAADTFFTRLGANYTQFIPVGLIRVPETTGTFIFNVQGGTIPFDAPPGYEAYVLGGSSSVRGYSAGEVGSPRNFVQGSVEYRFPFASIDIGNGFLQDLLGENWVLAGNVFFDAATGFDSDDTVIGQPGDARDKPGEGYGYGVGLLTTSTFGLVRLEFGITGGGDTSLIFAIGDRF
jgi:outer membrane protein insertion porin family